MKAEAQTEAWKIDGEDGQCDDYYPIAVFSGHLEDVR